jgi:hypothetical protein
MTRVVPVSDFDLLEPKRVLSLKKGLKKFPVPANYIWK